MPVNNFFPAMELQNPQIATNFLGGMQVGQEMQGQQIRNQFLQQQQAQQQAQMQREQQFNSLLGDYLGQNTVNTLTGQGGGTPGTAPGTAPGNAPGAAPLPPELFALDPERAFDAQNAIQTQRDQQMARVREGAAQGMRAAQFVLNSENPKRLLETAFPDMAEKIRAQGIDLAELTDDDVRGLANDVIAQLGPMAGVGPADGESPFAKINPADYTPESVRQFESTGDHGDLVAREKPGDDPTDKLFSRQQSLRKEYDARRGNFETIRSAYQNVIGADDNEAGDTQLMVNFMRLIAPGVRVQPGQELDAKSLPSGLQSWSATWNKFVNDGQLGPKERANIRAQARRTFETQEKIVREDRTRYTELAEEAGIEPWKVVGRDNAASSSGRGAGTTPGNLPPRNAKGWQLMEDANGNKAYVSPDGDVEEVG